MKLYSVIIPVFNEQEAIISSYNRIKAVMDALNNPYELIFVDDGSADESLSLLKIITETDSNAKVLSFSRNFGHQIAVSAGLDKCKGDAVIIIDADMQDPPEVIPDMLRLWKEGYDIVYGKRRNRKGESFFKKATASAYYRLLGSMSSVKIPNDTGDFRLIDRKVVEALKGMPERHRYLRGMNAWTGFKQYAFEYDREERKQGKSKYSLKKMMRLAADGIMSMSLKPLNMVFMLGIVLSILGLGLIAAFIAVWAIKAFYPALLLASLMVFLSGLIITSYGILGAYIGRIYDEVRNRPLYIIKEMINFKD